MTKYITIILILAFTLTATPALAHNVYDDYQNVIAVISDEIWEKAMAELQANHSDVPVVARGSIIKDEHGVTEVCPIWYFSGCSDLTKTKAYKEAMTNLAKHLIQTGQSFRFPFLKGWIDSVK